MTREPLPQVGDDFDDGVIVARIADAAGVVLEIERRCDGTRYRVLIVPEPTRK